MTIHYIMRDFDSIYVWPGVVKGPCCAVRIANKPFSSFLAIDFTE